MHLNYVVLLSCVRPSQFKVRSCTGVCVHFAGRENRPQHRRPNRKRHNIPCHSDTVPQQNHKALPVVGSRFEYIALGSWASALWREPAACHCTRYLSSILRSHQNTSWLCKSRKIYLSFVFFV